MNNAFRTVFDLCVPSFTLQIAIYYILRESLTRNMILYNVKINILVFMQIFNELWWLEGLEEAETDRIGLVRWSWYAKRAGAHPNNTSNPNIIKALIQ